MIVGTANFVSREAAIRYYKPYGLDGSHIDDMVRHGAISIGKPGLKSGESLVLLDEGTRYGVVS